MKCEKVDNPRRGVRNFLLIGILYYFSNCLLYLPVFEPYGKIYDVQFFYYEINFCEILYSYIFINKDRNEIILRDNEIKYISQFS